LRLYLNRQEVFDVFFEHSTQVELRDAFLHIAARANQGLQNP
jgi:hypothetical protein